VGSLGEGRGFFVGAVFGSLFSLFWCSLCSLPVYLTASLVINKI
jgi:hypothetical protein